MRELGTSINGAQCGVFTGQVGALTNDFFVAVTDMAYVWEPSGYNAHNLRKREAGTDEQTATRADLVFCWDLILRSKAEVYTQDNSKKQLVHDFVIAWTKVMNADRFDLVMS